MAKSASYQVKEATGGTNPKGSRIPPREKSPATTKVRNYRGRYTKVGGI